MFEVSWTDPDRELVGEHRAKKKLAREKEQAEKQQVGGQGGALQPVTSARDSSSLKGKAFGFFGSKNLRKAVATVKSRPTSTSSALLAHAPAHRHSNPLSLQQSPKQNPDALKTSPGCLEEEKLPDQVPARHSRNERISYPSSRGALLEVDPSLGAHCADLEFLRLRPLEMDRQNRSDKPLSISSLVCRLGKVPSPSGS